MIYNILKSESDIRIMGRILKNNTVAISRRLSICLPCTKLWRRPGAALFTHANGRWGGVKP